MFKLLFTEEAIQQLTVLKENNNFLKQAKAVYKALAYLENNPKHPSLNTHKFHARMSPSGEDVFEAYAENKTPGAHRIFWHYGPRKKEITIIAITPHP